MVTRVVNVRPIATGEQEVDRFSREVVKALQDLEGGSVGPAGPAGATGPAGPTGAAGATGSGSTGGIDLTYNLSTLAALNLATAGNNVDQTLSNGLIIQADVSGMTSGTYTLGIVNTEGIRQYIASGSAGVKTIWKFRLSQFAGLEVNKPFELWLRLVKSSGFTNGPEYAHHCVIDSVAGNTTLTTKDTADPTAPASIGTQTRHSDVYAKTGSTYTSTSANEKRDAGAMSDDVWKLNVGPNTIALSTGVWSTTWPTNNAMRKRGSASIAYELNANALIFPNGDEFFISTLYTSQFRALSVTTSHIRIVQP